MGKKRKHRLARKHPQNKSIQPVQVTRTNIAFSNGKTTEEMPLEDVDRLLDKYLRPEATEIRAQIKRILEQGCNTGQRTMAGQVPAQPPGGKEIVPRDLYPINVPLPPGTVANIQVKLFPDDFVPFDPLPGTTRAEYEALVRSLQIISFNTADTKNLQAAILGHPEVQQVAQDPRHRQILEQYWEACQYKRNHIVPDIKEEHYRSFLFLFLLDNHVIGSETVQSTPVTGIPPPRAIQPLPPNFSGLHITDFIALAPVINARLQAEGYRSNENNSPAGEMLVPETLERECAACKSAIDLSRGYEFTNGRWLCPACIPVQEALQAQYDAESADFRQKIMDAGQIDRWAECIGKGDDTALLAFLREIGLFETHLHLEELRRRLRQ